MTLSFASGPRADVTASHCVRHRTDRFDAVEAHGEDGALFVADPGAMSWSDADGSSVRLARAGRSHRPVPLDRPPTPRDYTDGVAALAAAVRESRRPYVDGRHGANVVAVAGAAREAADGGPVAVRTAGSPHPDRRLALPRRTASVSRRTASLLAGRLPAGRMPPAERDRLTVPVDDEGERHTVDVSLAETWAPMESLHEDGLAPTLGICNVSVDELRSLCATADVQSAVV